jgi:phosphomannomutase
VHAAAGVMVTASHNPPADNGYKVYEGNGAQITSPVDEAIAQRIAQVGPAREIPLDATSPRIGRIGAAVLGAYLDDAVAVVPLGDERDVRVVYTPLHGVGRDALLALFERAGFPPPTVVAEQGDPDADFPTTPFPNPEEPGALDLAYATATRCGADVVLANDPDADRLAIAVPDHGATGWRALTGDELGSLLADELLRRGAGAERLVVTTIVSSTMLDRIAAAHGVQSTRTLTGFKWIARAVEERPGTRFVFGYEEALGYAIGPHARDKDGLTAALAVAGLAARAKATSSSIPAMLDALAARHGVHLTGQWSVRLDGPTGAHEMRELLGRLRAQPPVELRGDRVTAVTDLLAGMRRTDRGDEAVALPASDLLVFELASGSRVLVRPSGTEPKLKCYFEVVEPVPATGAVDAARRRAGERLAALRAAFGAAAGLR